MANVKHNEFSYENCELEELEFMLVGANNLRFEDEMHNIRHEKSIKYMEEVIAAKKLIS